MNEAPALASGRLAERLRLPRVEADIDAPQKARKLSASAARSSTASLPVVLGDGA
jgi:hypothetical protein